jgi:hypothetical protein
VHLSALSLRVVAALITTGLTAGVHALEWAGYISVEPRYFIQEPLFADQPARGVSPSAVLAPELRHDWNGGDDRITVAPLLRWDADDHARTHLDLREVLWQRVRGDWVWRLGIGRVFWGVTESRHLVDIVNQTDLVEDIDEEDKLGQPMIHAERWTPIGSFDVFLLPGFRERTFPDESARLRGSLPVDVDAATYDSGAGKRRTDVAVRWSRPIGRWDAGLSGFHGTGREPRLVPAPRAGGEVVLEPHYDVIEQLGLDLQYTQGAWLWKLETIARRGQGRSFAAAVAGFEYTAFGVAGTAVDVGLLAEYLYDDRGPVAPPTPLDDDWFGGLRLSFNDVAGSSILGGAIIDDGAVFGIFEAERRLGNAWKVEVEARWFVDAGPANDLVSGFRRDSFVTLRMALHL